MSTELDTVIDAEVVETVPLTETKAKQLDKKIRLIVTTISSNMDKLAGHIADAKAGRIDVALGYPSWTAYLADVMQIGWHDRADRSKIVALLSREGMSQRAIAAAVGVSKQTVQADQKQVDEKHPPTDVVGLDGKQYRRKPEPKAEPKPEPKPKHSAKLDAVEQLVHISKLIEADHRVAEFEVAEWLVRLVESAAPNLTEAQRNRIAKAVSDN